VTILSSIYNPKLSKYDFVCAPLLQTMLLVPLKYQLFENSNDTPKKTSNLVMVGTESGSGKPRRK